jgi:hypothetical protein
VLAVLVVLAAPTTTDGSAGARATSCSPSHRAVRPGLASGTDPAGTTTAACAGLTHAGPARPTTGTDTTPSTGSTAARRVGPRPVPDTDRPE